MKSVPLEIEMQNTKLEPQVRKLPDNIKIYEGNKVNFTYRDDGILIANLLDAFGQNRKAIIEEIQSIDKGIITCIAKDIDPELPYRYYTLKFAGDDRLCWICIQTSNINGSKILVSKLQK